MVTNSWDVCEARRGLYEIEPLREIMAHVSRNYPTPAFIAGGYARWIFSPAEQPVPPDDLDIFCPSAQCGNELINALRHSTLVGEYISIARTAVGYTISRVDRISVPVSVCGCVDMPAGIKVWYGTPEEIISHFDFSVVRVALTGDETGICDSQFNDDESNKRITLRAVEYSIRLIDRIAKYVKKGYSLSSTELIKVFMAMCQTSKAEQKELKYILTTLSEGGRLDQTHKDALNNGELVVLFNEAIGGRGSS